MQKLTDGQIAEYFKRSYMAVDGLWFVKVEEKLGFERALELDVDVWKIMPKIQARKMKALAGVGEGMENLRQCLETKLALEGYTFATQENAKGFEFHVTRCPWLDIIINANREQVAEKVGTAICSVEYPAWAGEFSRDIEFAMAGQICKGDEACKFCFTRKGP